VSAFVKTDTILDRILTAKADVIAGLRSSAAALRHAAESAPPARDFAGALRQPGRVALIAEIKHASPSKGVLIDPFDPAGLARTYADYGADALSVLTDEPFFMGHVDDLIAARAAVSIPVLRKDFIIDPLQVWQARAAGADAALLIVMALEDAQLRDLAALITGLGMMALVEAHNEAECERALAQGAQVIGINNRDLRTFHEDITITARCAALVPPEMLLVAESAMRTAADVAAMGAHGADAALVGEGLLKARDIGGQVRAFRSQPKVSREGR
jgi:indole-3-glycerol phosphate synthase